MKPNWYDIDGSIHKLRIINLPDELAECGKIKISEERLAFGLKCDLSTMLSGGRE